MSPGARKRGLPRRVSLDRSLEEVPLFRLSDSPEDAAVAYSPTAGGRWRVLPAPGDRLPGTFDQDVYIELMRRYQEAESPADGAIVFTLHAFLHSMGRQVDGRTYEQLRSALYRLEHTVLESAGAYRVAERGAIDVQFPLLSALSIERRRAIDREQLALFDAAMTADPGEVRAVIAAPIRENIAARHVVTLSLHRYLSLPSPVARRLYRLIELARAEGRLAWREPLDRLKEMLPLVQRFPSHLQRVLQPAHQLLIDAGILRSAVVRQERRQWHVDYVLGSRTPVSPGDAEPAPAAPGRRK